MLAQSTHSLHLRASERGDHVANRVRTALTPTLPAGSVATIRAKVKWLHGHPEVLFRLKGGYLEAAGRLNVPVNLGTPGGPNNRALANLGPAISDVSHRPVLPQANKSISVSARVNDPDGVSAVTLKYRLDPDANLVAVPMLDDGTGGDVVDRKSVV